MTNMLAKALTDRANSLKGKRVEVSEAGYEATGLVKEIKVTDKDFFVHYIAGSELETHHIGGAWGWASISELSDSNTLRVSVPMVGSAVIYLDTP